MKQFVSKLLIWLVTGDSLLVRPVSPVIVAKYAVHRQIKTGNLKLFFIRGRKNIFVSCEEKDCYQCRCGETARLSSKVRLTLVLQYKTMHFPVHNLTKSFFVSEIMVFCTF